MSVRRNRFSWAERWEACKAAAGLLAVVPALLWSIATGRLR